MTTPTKETPRKKGTVKAAKAAAKADAQRSAATFQIVNGAHTACLADLVEIADRAKRPIAASLIVSGDSEEALHIVGHGKATDLLQLAEKARELIVQQAMAQASWSVRPSEEPKPE